MVDDLLKELPAYQYNSVLKAVFSSDVEKRQELRQITFDTLRRLAVKRNAKQAVARAPRRGSNDFSVGSFKWWADRIDSGDKAAIEQLVTIDATLVSRG